MRILFLILFFSATMHSSFSLAQEATPIELSKRVHSYLEQLIERKMRTDLSIALEKQGYSASYIDNVLRSSSFQKLVKDVVFSPEVQKEIQRVAQDATSPEKILAAIQKRRAEAIERQAMAQGAAEQAASRRPSATPRAN